MKKNCTHCGSLILRNIHPSTKRPFCDSTCYGKWQRGKGFLQQGKPMREPLKCKIRGCDMPHAAHGYCRKHYLSEDYTPPPTILNPRTRKNRKCEHCGTVFLPPLKSSRYCSMACSADARRKPYIMKKGYKKLLAPRHPRADAKGYVFEHIVVMEACIGRPLRKGEEIHHKDHDRANNDIGNLVLCASHKEHMAYHLTPSISIE